jgi:hypothetical protein
MKKSFRKLVSLVCVSALAVSMLTTYCTDVKAAAVSGHELKNPVKEDSNTEWDCVWFGSYPQAEVVPSGMYTAIDNDLLQDGDVIVSEELYDKLNKAKDMDWNENGDINLDGTYYRRIKKSDATSSTVISSGPLGKVLTAYQWDSDSEYHYFKYEPIKWRVLNITGDDALLLADQGLDNPAESKKISYWNRSEVRTWLNGDSSDTFIKTAFSAAERAAIKTSQITENQTIVSDKIFLLSESDVLKESYGFSNDETSLDRARWSRSSTFSKAMGTHINKEFISIPYYGCSPWMLRSAKYNPPSRSGPANYQQRCVGSMGNVVYTLADYTNLTIGCSTVRPVLRLDISSSSRVCSYAGTVNSNGR